MARRTSSTWRATLVAAVVAAMLLAVGVRAQGSSAIPRCDQDMTTTEAQLNNAYTGLITYQGFSYCQTNDDASLEFVKEPAAPNTVFALDEWTYIVGVNSVEPAVLTVNALCGTTVTCQAQVTYAVPTPAPHSSSHAGSSSSGDVSPYPACTRAANTATYKPGATYQEALPLDLLDAECVYTAELDQPSTGTVTMTTLPLQYRFSSPAGSSGKTSFGYRVVCDGAVVCQSTRKITFDANSAVPDLLPACSPEDKSVTFTSGTTTSGRFALALQDGDCVYAATVTQPPYMGTLTPAATGLAYTYAAPSGAVTNRTSTVGYTIQCSGTTVCQDAMRVTVVPAPEPTYPSCSQSSKTVNYAVSSTQTSTFPMDVQVNSCAYTTTVSTWPSVGLIVPDSTGLGYLYVMPNTAVAGTVTAVGYTVRCDGDIVCKDKLTVRVTPEESTAYPLCSHGNKQRSYPVGTTSMDSFPLDLQDGSCAYTTSIAVGPSVGTVTPSASGLGFTYAVPSTAAVGAATSLGYRVACDGDVVCADMLAVSLAPIPPTTTTTTPAPTAVPTTSTPAPQPEVLPSCSHSTEVRTYRIGELYTGELPLDVQQNDCVYTASVADPAVGTVAVMDDVDPLRYVYQTQMGVLPQDTSLPYTIACDGTNICSGAVAIHLTADAAACPNKAVSYVMKPGAAMAGSVSSGLVCESGATPTATLRSSVTGMTLTPAGAFTFQAPSSEIDVLATVYMRCDGVVTCQTEVVFVVAANTISPATTTTSTVAPIAMCAKSFTYDVPTGQSLSGKLDPVSASSCNITTYLVSNSTSDVSGRLRVNLLGQFYYTAPNVQKVDYAAVDVYCAKEFVCRTQLAFTAYTPLPSANPTTSPLQPCANVYYYEAAPGVAIKTSLNGMSGQDICAHGRYFTLNTAPQSGSIEMTPIGDFVYRPPTQEGQFQFTFTMYCLNQQYCSGTAYLLVSNQWTLSPDTSTTSGPNGPVIINNPQITCRGTCNAEAWKTYPTPRVWDNTPGAGYARKDGRAVDGISVTWRNNSLVFFVYSLIGNLGVRFPTFEAITSTKGAFMESADFTSTVASTSPGFEMSCLDHQGRAGLGEDVWKWMSLAYGSGTGSVGAYYHSGSSWYQKFGGKHVGCDTFAESCLYAPLLTPANYTNSSLGRWSIDVNDCDATWTGVFPYNSLEKMLKHDKTPVWTFVADRQVQGTLYSEAVQASSWLAPGQFETHADTHDILISLNQFVAVTKTGTQESLISVDAEFFTYVDAATGDEAFGINMLVYPYVDATMTTSYARDRHVAGFKWVQQEWQSPDAEQCPTCTGSKLKCVAPLEGTDATYKGAFPEGDCANGQGRVHLFKGPSMTVDDCADNKMHVYNRSGFSPTRNCKATYQNVTLRGIVPGSRDLSATLKHAFNFEGNIQLMLQMDDGSLERLNMHLSMYVSRLSKDAQRVDGALNTCRSGSYWPVLDPLGTSTAAHPFGLSVSEATPLCIDDLSSSYGPSDWALFTMNMPGVKPSEVTVSSVYVLLSDGTRVYLIYKDPATGAVAIPEAAYGAWWQYKYPFLAFRDLSAFVANSSITFSPQMAASAAASDIVYAFTFIPGSLGVDTDIELVVEAVIQQSGAAASSTEFRRVLHVDPLLTQLSRQGPTVPKNTTSRDDAKRDLYAIGATAGVAVALVVTVIFFMLADNNRPLPKWVPRGKLIKETVLSVLPAGMRGKKKPKRVVHKDMYDAMNSGRY